MRITLTIDGVQVDVDTKGQTGPSNASIAPAQTPPVGANHQPAVETVPHKAAADQRPRAEPAAAPTAAKVADPPKPDPAPVTNEKPGRSRTIVMAAVAIGALLTAALLITAYATKGIGLFGSHDPAALALSGNVDIRQVDLGFRVAGRIAEIPFEEGARVPAGALLASLNRQPLRDQLAIQEAGVAAASALLERQRNGNRTQEIAQAEARLAEVNAQLARAQEDLDRRTRLVASGAVSQAVFETSRSQFLAAQAQVRSAEQALSLQRAGARKEDIAAAVAQRNQAIAQRDKATTDLADVELHAPNAGVILTRAREPGAIVQAGDTVLTLTMDRPLRIRAYVDEKDLGRVAPGMAVEVTTDGSARTYHGTIGHVSPTAEFTPKTVQTQDLRTDLVYSLRVIVDDPDDGMRQGQPVTVRVAAGQASAAAPASAASGAGR